MTLKLNYRSDVNMIIFCLLLSLLYLRQFVYNCKSFKVSQSSRFKNTALMIIILKISDMYLFLKHRKIINSLLHKLHNINRENSLKINKYINLTYKFCQELYFRAESFILKKGR